MAVNPQKLLPPPSSALVKVGKIKTSKKSENNSTDSTNTIDTIKKELEKIKENLEKIYSLVLDNNKLTEKDLEVKRLSAERLKFAEKEKRLEAKDPEKKDEKDDKSISKLGIFDRINRFITFTLLGWVAVRLVKYLPKLLEFSKNLLPVMEFFSSFTANFFKGVVDFIDFGYNAYDKVKDFVKGIGGEPFEKAFDNFSSNLNKFVNLAIIAGIAASGGTDFGLGKKPGSVPKPGQGGRPRVTTSGGGGAGRPDLRNPLRQRPNITGSGGGRAGTPDIRNPLRQKPKITGSGGSTLGKFGGKVFGRIPIIGGLVSFIISILSGEPVGRAAAKAVGFSIGSALGTFIPVPFVGTILGGMLGDIVGGALYDTLVSNKKEEKTEVVAKRKGGTVKSNSTLETFNQDKKSKILYPGQDVLQKGTRERIIDHTGIDPIESRNTGGLLGFNKENIESRNTGGFNKENIESRNTGGLLGFNKENIESRNTGGFNKENNNSNITRGGKKVGGPVQRKVRRVVKRIVTPPKSTPIAAGKSVGGKEKLKELFPEPPQGQVGKSMDPYGYTTGTSEKLGQIPFLGPLFNIFGKTLLGDLPNKSDYQKVGMGLGAWINTAVSQGQLQGNIVSAFSDGGMIEGFGRSDISGWVEKSVEELVKNKVTEAINELKRNLGLKSIIDDSSLDFDDKSYFDDPIEAVTPGVWGPLLDLIASKESGGNYEAMYPSTVLRGATKMTISEVARRATGAVGKYQQLPQYLISRARAAGLNPDRDLYSPQNQDIIVTKVNIGQNRGGNSWLRGEISDEVFMQRLSMEFAALPNARGNFYYTGQRSSIRPEQVKGALSKVKRGGNQISSLGRDHRGIQDRGRGSTGPIVDTGIRDYLGRPIKFVSPAARQFRKMSLDASKQGINLGPGISSTLRDWGATGSRHKTGEAFDINWNTPAGVWIRNNANKYGFRYNPYSSRSTHFDWIGKKDGGIIGKNIKSIQTQTSYDDGQSVVMLIQPVIIEKRIPMRTGGNKIAFIGGVNSNNTNNSSLFVG
jgi:hypothetical protein